MLGVEMLVDGCSTHIIGFQSLGSLSHDRWGDMVVVPPRL